MRAGLRRYGALLALPDARAPVIASALGAMPIGMFGLAILLLARETTGSFGTAGRVVGAFGLANALGAVAQGRLMDRLGQPRVLRVAAVGHLLALVGLVGAAGAGWPPWALALCAAAGGACLPQSPAAMRSLWGAMVSDPERRAAAYALVVIVFEVAVMTAPVIVAGLVALASPSAAVLVAAALGSGAAFAFAATAASRRWRGTAHDVGWLGPLETPGMRTVVTTMVAFGTAMGVIQVALPAFAAERGAVEAAGLLLGALSVGSLAGGLLYGARTWPGTPAARLAVLLLGLGTGFVLMATADVPIVLVAVLLPTGVLVAPTAVTASTLLDHAAPPGTATEAFTVMVMGIVAGNAAGNALGGAIVEGASYATATITAAVMAALGAAFTLARRRTL